MSAEKDISLTRASLLGYEKDYDNAKQAYLSCLREVLTTEDYSSWKRKEMCRFRNDVQAYLNVGCYGGRISFNEIGGGWLVHTSDIGSIERDLILSVVKSNGGGEDAHFSWSDGTGKSRHLWINPPN